MLVPFEFKNFDGGIADDTRNAAPNEVAITHQFDIYSKLHRLIPYRDMEAEAGSMTQYAIKSVELFTDSAGTQAFFALGNVSGQTYPQILEKTTVGGTFATSTSGAGAAGVVLAHTLIGYKNQNKLYFMKTSGGNTIVDSYDPAANTYASTVGTITGTSTTGVYPKPFRHPQDDIVYFGAGRVIASLNATTFTAAALTLPAGFTITSLTDFGVYLAITCAPIDQGGRSVCFLWGRDTSLTTLEENIDLGEGAAMIGENMGGAIIFISNVSQAGGSAVDINPKIAFRMYSGGLARKVKEIQWTGTGTPTTLLKNFKAKKDDYLFFACKQFIENKTVNQLWVCGRNMRGQFFVTPDRLINNDTGLTGNVDGFSIIGDFLWAGYNGDGSLKRTDDTANYTATAIYESPIINSGDSIKAKDLKGVTVYTEPMPTAGQIVCKYRVDAETTYTTIFTHTTDNSTGHSAINIESSGAILPTHKELQIRVESTGGAVITGIKGLCDVKESDIYNSPMGQE